MLIFYRERARWGESCTFLPVRDFPQDKVLFLIIQWNPAQYNEYPGGIKGEGSMRKNGFRGGHPKKK